MAFVSNALRTCGLIFYLFNVLCFAEHRSNEPWIVSFKISAKACVDSKCKYLLLVQGGEFLGHNSWSLTSSEGARGANCDILFSNYEIKEVKTEKWISQMEVLVPMSAKKLYFCLNHSGGKNHPFHGRWVHQGQYLFLDPVNDTTFTVKEKTHTLGDQEMKISKPNNEGSSWADLSHDIDVNYITNAARPTREEQKDIEVLSGDKYVPLDDEKADEDENIIDNDDQNMNDKRKLQYLKDDEMLIGSRFVPIGEVKVSGNSGNRNDGMDQNMYSIESDVSNFSKRKLQYLRHSVRNIALNVPDIKDDLKDVINSDIGTNEHDSDKDDSFFSIFDNNDLVNDINTKVLNKKVSIGRLKYNRKENDESNFSPVPEQAEKNGDFNDFGSKGKALKSHKGNDIDFEEVQYFSDKNPGGMRGKRQVNFDDFSVVRADPAVHIDGLRVEVSSKDPKFSDDGIPSVLADSKVTLRLFGQGLTQRTVIAFTYDALEYGLPCKFLLKGEYLAKEDSVTATSALFEFTAPSPISASKLYICAKNLNPGITDPTKDEDKYLHQGMESWKVISTHDKLLPLWATLVLILFCLGFSALFSGLNLGLMSLDRTELKIISNTGTEQERKHARAIMPVRDHGNYLLCSILLGNVAVNSTFTILLDDLTSGLFAVIFSTLSIVLFGEITPQAICSRHGLMIGARTIMVTKAVMALTAPLAFPISKLLDYFLGEEIGSVYNRERLKELVKVTTDVNDLDKDEVNIISGALELRKKKVTEVMTKLEDVFMLPITSILDFETMSEIIKSGYSRIPVYENHRGNIITVLFIKDLAFVDPDDNTPLRTLCQYYQNPCNFVFEDVTLDIMFKQFKEGHKGHMAFVHRINSEGEGDPFYETVGLVTLEDVIEEMIQAEIVDETDVFLDNRTKKRRNRPQNKLQDFAAFAERHENQRIHISPQLTLATFQFLSTSVDAFKPDIVSETVLRRLLKQDIIRHIKVKGKSKKDVNTFVFQQGKPVDHFLLILEGRVEVTVGRENLVFEAGPFTYFGVQALTQNVGLAESPTPSAMGSLQNINMDSMLRHTFVPDYSVRAITELYYLTVKRTLYLAAKRATLMEKGALSKGAINEQFDTEVDKVITLIYFNEQFLYIYNLNLGNGANDFNEI
ncbi:unextended protein-like [Leptidea sinapis]|uniref:unextended protein-like n=1 Tax=Leptidea sinapis TaxID=189913 RepID=UPI0021C4BC05|nr:unextended protein-like [Leptidea sinapis]